MHSVAASSNLKRLKQEHSLMLPRQPGLCQRLMIHFMLSSLVTSSFPYPFVPLHSPIHYQPVLAHLAAAVTVAATAAAMLAAAMLVQVQPEALRLTMQVAVTLDTTS